MHVGRKVMSNMYLSYYAVIFAGINTDINTFEHPSAEIISQLKQSVPSSVVRTKTIYPYDAAISGDTFSDTFQVVKNAYDLCGNTVGSMAEEIINDYQGEECVFFVGYSGGGIAATKTAEKLLKMNFKPLLRIIRVGSPVLTVGKQLYGRTVDLVLHGDPVTQLEIPRFIKNMRPYQCFIKNLRITGQVHSCYFRKDLTSDDGVSNLTKTTNKILNFVKN